ncbi:MAG: hypothetical protein MUO26_13950 [Methanotrichaceae archaeon]|nr:hypothetical protein [Methanotrichaceae archaeon]
MLYDQIFCPCCDEDTEHTIIKSGQEILVKCKNCNELHSHRKDRKKLTNIRVIVNNGAYSKTYQVNIPVKDELSVGRQLLIDDASKGGILTEITSLELDRRRSYKALAQDVKTIWTRVINEVVLKVSVFRKGETKNLRLSLPGSELCTVGEIREIEGTKFRVNKIKLRGQGFGKGAEAKDIVRIWGQKL